MNFKKTLVLLSFTPLLLTSCSNFGSHYLVRDLDSYFASSLFQEFTLDEIDYAMSIKHEFLVYLSSTGCSSCAEFNPEFEAYLSENHYLTYKYDETSNPAIKDEIIETYGEKFAKKDAQDNLYMTYPSVFIVHGDEVEEIPYSKLKNKTMIANTLKSYVKSNNVFYAFGNAFVTMVKNYKKLPFHEFAYISFDFKNASLMSYFQSSLQSYVNELSFPVVVTDFEEESGYMMVRKSTIDEDGMYGSKAEAMTKDTSNLSFVKEVIEK